METFDTPPVFWHPPRSTRCPDAALFRADGGKPVNIQADRPVLGELYSDAKHYASSFADYGPDFFGLCSSARATVNRLVKAFPSIATEYRGWIDEAEHPGKDS